MLEPGTQDERERLIAEAEDVVMAAKETFPPGPFKMQALATIEALADAGWLPPPSGDVIEAATRELAETWRVHAKLGTKASPEEHCRSLAETLAAAGYLRTPGESVSGPVPPPDEDAIRRDERIKHAFYIWGVNADAGDPEGEYEKGFADATRTVAAWVLADLPSPCQSKDFVGFSDDGLLDMARKMSPLKPEYESRVTREIDAVIPALRAAGEGQRSDILRDAPRAAFPPDDDPGGYR